MSSSSKAFKESLISRLRARACSIFVSHSRFALNSNGLKKERLLLSSRSSFPKRSNSSSSACFCDFLTGLSNQYLAWSSASFSARSRSFFFSGSYSSRFAMSFSNCSLRSCFASSLAADEARGGVPVKEPITPTGTERLSHCVSRCRNHGIDVGVRIPFFL